jgi:lipoprotein-anchoring transpeptidase ErfK/SrfK
MRNLTQVEITKPFASILNKTMKTSNVLTLLATLCLVATTASSVQADGFGASFSSKHPSFDAPRYTRTAIVDEGHFNWIDETATVNHIVVSLADQTLNAYHGDTLVATSNISSGKPGHETPTGDFTVSEKDPDHQSSIYENASMPFFMRLTDGGVGLHAGFIPGYPASHGCVRLPIGMARELFQHVEPGTPVEITSNTMAAATAPMTKPAVLAQN